jgi:DNA-binding SARP family transcriptional activator
MSRLLELLEPVQAQFDHFRQRGGYLLLQPRSKYRSVLVANLLRDQPYPVFYYALGTDDVHLSALLRGITHTLGTQHPMFGRHTQLHTLQTGGTLRDLAAAFARDLAELSDEQYVLILDEFDRCDAADDIQIFLEYLVDRLPAHCTIVFNSRTIPRISWISILAKNRAVILDDESLVRENFYDASPKNTPLLSVSAFGPGFVLLDDEPIESWEGHLPRLLFFFALDRPVITRSEICAAFWPDLAVDQAVNVFHVTKRRLHKALNMDVLVHEDGYYRMNGEIRMDYDVANFVSRIIDARESSGQARFAHYSAAADLYQSPYLHGYADAWITMRRADFSLGYLEALTNMAEYRIGESRLETALNLLLRALHESPDDEALHRQVMRLFTQLGRRSEAVTHFKALETRLHQQNQLPARETIDLYTEIMA